MLRARKVRPLHTEGHREAQWVLMDYGDFVVHVFQEDTRHFYGLERLWGDAPEVTSQFTDGPRPSTLPSRATAAESGPAAAGDRFDE